MKNLTIKLNSIDKVKSFVDAVSKFDCDLFLTSGRYVIDAKSIMGIFSFNLTNAMTLRIPSDRYEEVKDAVAVYAV